MISIIFIAIMFLTNEEIVYDENGVILAVEKPTFVTLSGPEVTKEATDKTIMHNMSFAGFTVGSYTLTERTLENDVTIVFDEVYNSSWLPLAIALLHKGLENPEINSWNPRHVSTEADDVFGKDPTSNPFGTIAADGKHFLQGNLYGSRMIPQADGGQAHELRTENPDFTIKEGQMKKSFWLPPKHTLHTWLIIADKPFFHNKKMESTWIQFALDNRYQQLNWLTPAGPLVKLPITEDQRTQLAYGYIDERTADPASREWNAKSPSLYFETMLLNAEASENH